MNTIIAGTVASGGSLRVLVTAVGEQTALSGIMRLVAAAQASGSRSQALAECNLKVDPPLIVFLRDK